MGEVVDMTGRVVVADEHPLGVESVEHVSVKDRELLRVAWDEAPELARYLQTATVWITTTQSFA